MEFDIHSEMKVETVIGPSDGAAAGAATVGVIIDTLDFEGFEYVISVGTITTGTFAVVLEESDVVTFGGEETVVPAANVVGGSPTWIATDDDQDRRVGIVGKKRFQRLTLNGASTPVADFCAMAILGRPNSEPVADQQTAS